MLRRQTWFTSLSIFALLACSSGCGADALSPVGDPIDVGDDDDDDSPWIEEEYYQQPGEATDVLFVVDNSCSMMEEQNALQTNFYNFAQWFVDSNMDYHVGITVLDDYQGQPTVGQLYGPTRYIDPSTPDPVGAFTGNMTMGYDGWGNCEVGLSATQRALSEPLAGGYNHDFYSDDAYLMVVIVTDEDDGSYYDSECYGGNYVGYQEFIPWFTQLKGEDGLGLFHFAAITGDAGAGCSSAWGDAEAGDGYLDVVDALGDDATFHSICDQDWSDVMSDLGQRAANYQTEFGLGAPAQEDSIQVFLDLDGPEGPLWEMELEEDHEFELPFAYIYNEGLNALAFTYETKPPPGSLLRVRYLPAE